MTNDAKRMVTYKRLDGELIHDEYGWTTELPDEDDSDVPITYLAEFWQRTEATEITQFPPLYDCGLFDCDNVADGWFEIDGNWDARCVEHKP